MVSGNPGAAPGSTPKTLNLAGEHLQTPNSMPPRTTRCGTPHRLADCHVHLGFMSNAKQVAQEAEQAGALLFVNTVTPREYLELRERPWTQLPNVRLGVGLHPWWMARGTLHANPEVPSKNPYGASTKSAGSDAQPSQGTLRPGDYADVSDMKLAEALAAQSRWIGEVGLDFSPQHTDPSTKDAQVKALRRMLQVCATPLDAGKRAVSVHSVASADVTLNLLEETGVAQTCNCILHWFSESTPALWRAIHLGCWFSINERQTRARRAKEQLKLIPDNRLLLETDLPPAQGKPFAWAAIEESLLSTCNMLGHIRGHDSNDIRALTTRNAEMLLCNS